MAKLPDFDLDHRTRTRMLTISAALIVGSFVVPWSLDALAQEVDQSHPAPVVIAMSTPSDGDVVRDITHDPYLNVFDHGGKGGAGGSYSGSGAMGAPVDIAYGEGSPVDTSVGSGSRPGQGSITFGTRPSKDGRTPVNTFARKDVLPRYIGGRSGNPPVAVLDDGLGHQLIVSIGDRVGGSTVATVSSREVRLKDGRTLAFDGGYSSARSGSARVSSFATPTPGFLGVPGSGVSLFGSSVSGRVGVGPAAVPDTGQTVPLSPATPIPQGGTK